MEKISRDWEKECLISYDNISSITRGILVRLKQETLPALSGLDMSSVMGPTIWSSMHTN